MSGTASQDPTRRDAVALGLIAQLYRAAIDPSEWRCFAAQLSEALAGAAVTLAIRRPEKRPGWDYFGAGSHGFAVRVAEDLQDALVLAARRVERFRRGFFNLGEAFPGIVLDKDPWFEQWCDPHGIAPVWPLCHAVTVDREIRCWIIVHSPPDGGGLDDKALVALEDHLVPHLARAFGIHCELGAQSHKQRALEEILDRLPTGVMLIDARRRVLHANLSAQRMLALEDGLSIQDDWLVAGADKDPEIEATIDAAIDAASDGDFRRVSRTTIATRSGRRPFLLAVTPLLRGVAGSPVHDAVALAYLASPDAISTASVQALGAVYGLTPAEAAIVQGLVQGQGLEEVAAQRGVKLETARGQLKQVFAKTRTRRQAELIRLVLAGVSPLSQAGPGRDGAS